MGPMARDMEGVVLAMKALLCDLHFTLDSEVPPIKFRDEVNNYIYEQPSNKKKLNSLSNNPHFQET